MEYIYLLTRAMECMARWGLTTHTGTGPQVSVVRPCLRARVRSPLGHVAGRPRGPVPGLQPLAVRRTPHPGNPLDLDKMEGGRNMEFKCARQICGPRVGCESTFGTLIRRIGALTRGIDTLFMRICILFGALREKSAQR